MRIAVNTSLTHHARYSIGTAIAFSIVAQPTQEGRCSWTQTKLVKETTHVRLQILVDYDPV